MELFNNSYIQTLEPEQEPEQEPEPEQTPSTNVSGVPSLTGAFGYGSLQEPEPDSIIRQLQNKKNAQVYQCDIDHLAWIDAGKLLIVSRKEIETAELAVEIAQLQLTAAKLKIDIQKKNQIKCEEKMVISHKLRSEIEYRINECITLKNEKKIAKTRIDFKKMLKLPEVMVDYIESFLSYDTRIHLLETKYNPYKLLHRLNKYAINHLIKQICLSPEFFKTLSVVEAQKQIFNYNISKPWEHYSPYWFCFSHIDSKNTAISMIYKLKKINPRAAHKWIQQISILINPAKNYKSHSDCYM